MKRTVLVAVMAFVAFSAFALVKNEPATNSRPLDIKFPKEEACKQQSAYQTPINGQVEVARRGCCSWHHGVCGCSGGRAVCCDGQLSPSCGCD